MLRVCFTRSICPCLYVSFPLIIPHTIGLSLIWHVQFCCAFGFFGKPKVAFTTFLYIVLLFYDPIIGYNCDKHFWCCARYYARQCVDLLSLFDSSAIDVYVMAIHSLDTEFINNLIFIIKSFKKTSMNFI